MKILVAGNGGIIEKNFVKLNKKAHEIIRFNEKEQDLTKYETVKDVFDANVIDTVVFFASEGKQYTGEDADSSIIVLYKNIQFAAAMYGVRKMIVISDCSDCDNIGEIIGAKEDSFGNQVPNNLYGANRYMIARLAEKDKISTVLRICPVFGKGTKAKTNAVSALIADTKRKGKIVVDKDKIVSLMSIYDAVEIIKNFATKDYPAGTYNVSPTNKTTYGDIAKAIRRAYKAQGRNLGIVNYGVMDTEVTYSNEKLLSVMPKAKFSSINKVIAEMCE